MTRLVVLDTDFPDLDIEAQLADERGVDIVLADPPGAVGSVEDVAALLTMWTNVDERMIDSITGLQVVGRIGLGVDTIDVKAASERGIAVVNSGDYATEEVAIHSVALLLALVRQITVQDSGMRAGRWLDRDAMTRVRRLSAMTAGVIGLGHIGCRVAEILTAVGMEVIGFDPASPPCPVPTVDTLDDLLARSDVVLLHVPLTDTTRGLIGRGELDVMGPRSLLINTSRGGVVDHDAMMEALRDGRLAGAGLDVYETEPLSDPALLELPQVVLTPHVAYYSPESLLDARTRTMEGILAVLEDRRPDNQVN